MTTSSGFSLVVSLPLLASLLPSSILAAPATEKPNIVLIYADDIGYGDFSCYGAKTITTPNVDRLAAEGQRFTSAYASSATCTPSRFSLLTGQYAFRREGTGILPGDAAAIIRPGSTTLASILKDKGYTTGVVGKWHLGLGDGNVDWNHDIHATPLDIGFDYSFIMAATGDRVPCVFVENRNVVNLDPADPIEISYKKPFPGLPTGVSDRANLVMDWSHGHNAAVINRVGRIGYMKGGKSAIWKDEEMMDRFTGKAVEFIEKASTSKKPFFLYFATHDNHVPRIPHPRHVGKTPHGPRGDAVVEFDVAVGEVIKTLDQLGLTENTMVILTSDNGAVLDDGYKDQANELLGDHKPSGPWRGGKYSIFEGGTRMPTIVRWPARVKPGVSGAIISQVDFPATLAALTGRPLNADEAPDSINVLPALLGESPKGREDLVEHAHITALRSGDWKFIPPGSSRDGLGPWKTVKIKKPGALYNLADDPGETTDLAKKHPAKVKKLAARLDQLMKSGRSRPR